MIESISLFYSAEQTSDPLQDSLGSRTFSNTGRACSKPMCECNLLPDAAICARYAATLACNRLPRNENTVRTLGPVTPCDTQTGRVVKSPCQGYTWKWHTARKSAPHTAPVVLYQHLLRHGMGIFRFQGTKSRSPHWGSSEHRDCDKTRVQS